MNIESSQILSIVLGFLGIAFVIAFHELGHFLFCKLFKIKTPSFSIGFGPKLISKKIGDTFFSLSLIPMGGYVEIAGIEEVGQGEQKSAKDKSSGSFANKLYYQKALVLLGGIIFNIIFAYVTFVFLFMTGMPKTPILYPEDSKVVIDTVLKDSAAEKAGITPNDSILKINNVNVANNLKKTVSTIKEFKDKTVTIEIENNNKIKTVTATIPDSLGITFKEDSKIIYDRPLSFIKSIKKSWNTSLEIMKKVGSSLLDLIKNGKKDNLGGPIMVIKELVNKAKSGFSIFMIFLSFISINLAILNLIPLPIFDGGQLVKVTIEAIIGKPLPEKVVTYIDYACWISVIGLMIFISLMDIKKIFGL